MMSRALLQHFAGYILLFTLCLCTGCTQQAKWRVGVSQCSDDDWRDKVNAEIRREAMFHPELEVVIRSGDDSNERQIEDIRWFQNEGFDLIIAAPNEADALTQVVKEVYDAGTPVIIFDRRINGRSYTAFVGADNEAIGSNAALYAQSAIGGGKTVNAIEICGLSGSTPSFFRHKGFAAQALQSGINIVGHGDGQWRGSVAAVVADSLLRVHPEANVIFAHNDHMAIAAAEAARRMRRYDIIVIGVDGAPNLGMQAVKDGKIDATFVYPTEGYTLVRTALDILEGRPYQRENVAGIPSAVTNANAEILLKQNALIEEETAKIERLQEALADYWHRHSIQTWLLWAMVAVAMMLVVTLVHMFHSSHVKAQQRNEIKFQRDELHELQDVIEDLHDAAQAPAAIPQPDDTFIQRFNASLDRLIADSSITVEDIANDMGLSRVQLYRRVKAYTGCTPVEMIRRRRLTRADELIRTTSTTIAEIAYAVGFTSPSYFTKCYHEYFKRLPTDVLRNSE